MTAKEANLFKGFGLGIGTLGRLWWIEFSEGCVSPLDLVQYLV